MSLAIPQQLVATLPLVCTSPYKVGLYWVAFLVAFGGAFRLDERVSGSRTDTSG